MSFDGKSPEFPTQEDHVLSSVGGVFPQPLEGPAAFLANRNIFSNQNVMFFHRASQAMPAEDRDMKMSAMVCLAVWGAKDR